MTKKQVRDIVSAIKGASESGIHAKSYITELLGHENFAILVVATSLAHGKFPEGVEPWLEKQYWRDI